MIKALLRIVPETEEVLVWQPLIEDSLHCDRYVFAQGLLYSKHASEQTEAEVMEQIVANYTLVVSQCERIFAVNPVARICVLGSESGYKGSYNQIYAGAKAALHQYVETRKLEHPRQQLVAVAPTIIQDSGMTMMRPDYEQVVARGRDLRRGQWLKAEEVARAIHFLLYTDTGAICNTVLRMTGGV